MEKAPGDDEKWTQWKSRVKKAEFHHQYSGFVMHSRPGPQTSNLHALVLQQLEEIN